ncbi:asparagine synthase-related protein [Halorubrum tebenquichense]|uniref:Asparagine synthetase domain-containing protein n=1 Tax=Halorubrum tebenquichense DSM 14210 TaxID=1227485 RepID=M0DXH5_9EURY|nr:asparagine synthetase B family protein [Halorubrum tebenquichense]ELZ39422.1 hypothetical protein C472_03888 [Halorubrum tebenquichense DSM 14210]
MSSNINLNPEIWSKNGDVHVRGHAFHEGEYKAAKDLAALVKDTENVDELSLLLSSLNGFFSVVVDDNNKTIFAADRMRTGPIFYSLVDNELQVSDNCGWVIKQTPDLTKSELSEVEYETTRFVTGPYTLYEEVKQLQSGEVVVFEKDSASFSTQQHHLHTVTESNYEQSELNQEFQRVLDSVFERLTEVADGRPIVVPLSGGYDSRLIALMLKRVGYDNVITYTIDTGGDTTSIAREVAEDLGFPWVTAEETHSEWDELYNSDEWNDFFDMAGYLGGLPNPTGIPTMKKLRRSGKIPEDALIVPGHSALDSMKATPKDLENTDDINLQQLTDHIVKQHYKYNEKTDIPKEMISDRIVESIGIGTSHAPKSSDEAFERWRLKERRTKLIFNGNRNFDFFGWDCWVPLEDNELYEFWRKVPMEQKRHRSFYENHIENLYVEVGGVSPEKAGVVEDESLKMELADKIRDLPIWPVVRQMYYAWDNSLLKYEYMKRFQLDEIYESDYRFGIMSPEKLQEHYEGQKYIFFSLLARSTTDKIDLQD